MRYLEMGLASAAIGFLVANVLISFFTVLLWRVVRSRAHRARSLFAMRMLPTLGSLCVVIGLVLPAFFSFEPRGTAEEPGPALVGFVLLAGVFVGTGLYRTFASWRETRRLERLWIAAAVGGAEAGLIAPAYRVASELPFAALVGVLRPRLFLSGRFIDSLSAGERQAVLDHEAGHLRALDNLKRIVMRLAPDWLAFFPAGAEIERAWAIAVEEEADDYAAGSDPLRSCDLASALLKAARFPSAPSAAVSNFCDHTTISHRVERLLGEPTTRRAPADSLGLRVASIAAILATATVLAGPAARAVYATTEAAIRLLQ